MDPADLEVVIVGAGIAGLSCALALALYERVSVTILEKESDIEPTNEGLHLTPNACKGLESLDLLDLFELAGSVASACVVDDHRGSRRLLGRDLRDCEDVYEAPWIFVHRADAMSILLSKVAKQEISVLYNSEVVDIDFSAPSLQMANGDTLKADVIIAADGRDSLIRRKMHPRHSPLETHAFSYRAICGCSSRLIESGRDVRTWKTWLGPDAHAVSFTLRNGESMQTDVIVASDEFNQRAASGDIGHLLNRKLHQDGWDHVLRDFVRNAPEVVRTALCDMGELPNWFEGNVVLVGDAAHPCLPYLSQGEAMAIEDGVVLGTLLGTLCNDDFINTSHKSLLHLIPKMLHAYEALQLDRSTLIVEESRKLSRWLHARPGRTQEDRDADFACYSGLDTTLSECPLIDSRFNSRLFGRNPEVEADRKFQSLKSRGMLQALEMEET